MPSLPTSNRADSQFSANVLTFCGNIRFNLADKWNKYTRVYIIWCLFAYRPHHNPCFLFIRSSPPLVNGYSHTNLHSDCNTHALAFIVVCLVARTACREGDTPTRHGSALMCCLTTFACDNAVTMYVSYCVLQHLMKKKRHCWVSV